MTEAFPNWREGAAKGAITEFVTRVTREDSFDFVPPPERTALLLPGAVPFRARA